MKEDIKISKPTELYFDSSEKLEYKNYQVKNMLTSFLATGSHPCLGAKSVMSTDTYDYKIFDKLGEKESAIELCESIYKYLNKIPEDFYPKLYSFFAVFEKSDFSSELDFEENLWRHLKFTHEYDKIHYDWDSRVSSDSNDSNFSFSIGGRAFYIVGMHPKSSRKARQFPMVMLVFNLHEQFQRLRDKGKYNKLKESIRNRDKIMNGSINPMMKDFGVESEVRQYSGRNVDNNWKCPFSSST